MPSVHRLMLEYTGHEYKEGIRKLVKQKLPLSGLVGFSIWNILQKTLPKRGKYSLEDV